MKIPSETEIQRWNDREYHDERHRVFHDLPVPPHCQIRNEEQWPHFDADRHRETGGGEQRPIASSKQACGNQSDDKELRVSVTKFFDEVRSDEEERNHQS